MLALLCAVAFAQQKSTITDPRDKKTYKTVKIGTQTWMAENLNYAAEGSKCGVTTPQTTEDCLDENTFEDKNTENCNKYGRLYDWNTALKACPNNWHLPSNAEWDKLMRFVDGTSGTETPYRSKMAGKLLKAASGWNDVNVNGKSESGNGTDAHGFAALPGGDGYFGSFVGGGYTGSWWSASENNASSAYYRYINRLESVDWRSYDKSTLFSVRCLQDYYQNLDWKH
jgi:uncharacterized protein (TIGR02145 family)